VGEAGVGKSRLLIEFVNQLPPGDVTYHEGRCLHYGGSIIYKPFLEVLKSYFGINEEDREFIINKKIKEKTLALDEDLAYIIPPFQSILSLKVDDENYLSLEPTQKREKTFEALRDLFIRASQEKPLILVIEDLHWIDKTSEEFLDYLIGWIAKARIMLILLYRPEYVHQWGSKSYYTKIGLTQLGTVSSSKLVQAILEEGEIVPELEELILNRAAGNPLFMEELTHSLLESGTIQKKDRKYVLESKTSSIQVPNTIQDIIAARMDRLEENLKRTMQVASVIGREFAFRILQTISGMRDEMKSYLLNLQGLEFIYEKSLFPELEYVFKHAFTQEVAYNSMLLTRRKDIHEKIGNAIQELYPHRLKEFYEMLAYHYSKSDNLEKAYQYLKLSGEKALKNHAHWEAFGFFRDAIKVLIRMPDSEEIKKKQIEVRLLIAAPSLALIYPEDSLSILQEGERQAEELGDRSSLAKFYSHIGFCHSLKGDHIQAIRYLENSFKEASKIKAIDLMVTAAWGLCHPYSQTGEALKLTDVASKILPLLEKQKREHESFGLGLLSPYAMLYGYYGISKGYLGNFEEGLKLCEKAYRFSEKVNDVFGLGLIEFFYGIIFDVKGDGENAIEHLQRGLKLHEEMRVSNIRGWISCFLSYGFYLLGELESARNHIDKSFKFHKGLGRKDGLSKLYNNLSLIHLASGKIEEAKIYCEKGLELAKENNETIYEAELRITLGNIVNKGDPTKWTEAEAIILTGLKMLSLRKLNPFYAQGLFYLGELYLDAGQKEKALKNLKKAEKMFKEMGMDYWLNKVNEILKRL
jgi:predicted ATPase